MIRVADYIFRVLADLGVRHVFLVTGGASMHLNDALARETRLQPVCNHHEQASAMAAEGYARISGSIGVLCVTAGPGAINALNGVFGAYIDSVPMLVLSGQAKRETNRDFYNLPGLRQLGDQEVNIVEMVRGITKYAAAILEPEGIRWELEKALYLAMAGRPGPCWLDIPVDVQSLLIDPDNLPSWSSDMASPEGAPSEGEKMVSNVLEGLLAAERPVLLPGSGVRISGATDLFRKVANRLQIPIATAWCADVIPTGHPCYCGRQGTIGTRAGNFTVQNADFVLILGSRMCIRQVSYNWKSFARHAFKVQVDIDPAELSKPTAVADLPICCDVKYFLEEMLHQLDAINYRAAKHISWLDWCRKKLARYPSVLAHHRSTANGINPYFFIETLFQQLLPNDVIACGDAMACIVPFQAAEIKESQRIFSNSGSASMGYDLPAAIGAAFARQGRVICLAGDGSIMMNIQELQTMAGYRLPIILFVLNNGGYASIRDTQSRFFGRLIGEGPESGVSFPDFVRLAQAHGLPAMRIEGKNFAAQIAEVLAVKGPMLCEVMLDHSQGIEPKLSSKRLDDGKMVTAPLEDMAPFLDRRELMENMIEAPPSSEASFPEVEVDKASPLI